MNTTTTTTNDQILATQMAANLLPIVATFCSAVATLCIAYLQKKMNVRLSTRHDELKSHLLEIKQGVSRSNSMQI